MSLKSLRSLALVATLIVGIPASAYAGPLLEKGLQQAAPPLRTYGKDVEWQGALHSILPTPWHLRLAPGVRSRAVVSWTPGDTWFEVLNRISDHLAATVIVNWNHQEVRIRPQTAAEHATWIKLRRMDAASRAKRTPAPRPHVISPPMSRAAVPTSALDLTSSVRACPVSIRGADTAAEESPRNSLPPLETAPAPRPSQTAAQAFYGVSVRVPFEALAHRYGLSLRYEALDYLLPGPVTLMLQGDLPADIDLLQRALGDTVPLAVTEYRGDKLLLVRDSAAPRFVVLNYYPRPKPSFFARLFGSAHTEAPATKPASAGAATGQPTAPARQAAPVAQAQTIAHPAPSASLVTPSGPSQDLTLHAVDAPFGPLFDQVAQANGYAVATSTAVDLSQPVTVDLHHEGVVAGLRALAAKAGCVAVIDGSTHVVTLLPVSALGAFSATAGAEQ